MHKFSSYFIYNFNVYVSNITILQNLCFLWIEPCVCVLYAFSTTGDPEL